MVDCIQDVKITQLNVFGDERGSVLKMISVNSCEFESFGEVYFSEINKWCIKAWKKHRFQTQNLCVPVGRIQLVMIDDRENSRTYKNRVSLKLERNEAFFLVKIPPGVIYGFKNLSDKNALIVNCTDIPHDPLEGIVFPVDYYNF
jgi:dTDP-4-dehydrorhamnose 3,5-epimerase